MIRSLYTSVSGMMNSQTRMDIIGNNIANANTLAFKANTAAVATSFDDAGRLPSDTQPVGISVGLGSQIVGTVRQFTQGATQRTDVKTDLAVQGSGFFAVEGADGSRFVTRAGNFVEDSQGFLRTIDGMYVLGVMGDASASPFIEPAAPPAGGTAGFPSDRIRIPATIDGVSKSSFSINDQGRIEFIGADGRGRTVGHITLQIFSNPNGLAERGGNLYVPSAAGGTLLHVRAGLDGAGKIQSGALELSNVDMAREFSEMIIVQRGFEANARTISASDEMLQTVTNMKR
jgi:flagellar hook protein FlgE